MFKVRLTRTTRRGKDIDFDKRFNDIDEFVTFMFAHHGKIFMTDKNCRMLSKNDRYAVFQKTMRIYRKGHAFPNI